MKTLIRAAALAAALALPAAAGDAPSADIVLTRHDGLIVATPKLTPAPGPDAVAVSYRWTVERDGVPVPPGSVEYTPDGGRLVLAEGPPGTRYTFRMAAGVLTARRQAASVGGTDSVVYVEPRLRLPGLSTRTLVVDGPPTPPSPPTPPAPAPAPSPSPAPAPAPALPQGRFGLAPLVYQAFSGDALLTEAQKKKAAAALADAYQGVVDRSAGQATFGGVLYDMTGSAHAAALATSIEPALLEGPRKKLSDRLGDLIFRQRSIASVVDLQVALAEAVVGLRAAAK